MIIKVCTQYIMKMMAFFLLYHVKNKHNSAGFKIDIFVQPYKIFKGEFVCDLLKE